MPVRATSRWHGTNAKNLIGALTPLAVNAPVNFFVLELPRRNCLHEITPGFAYPANPSVGGAHSIEETMDSLSIFMTFPHLL